MARSQHIEQVLDEFLADGPNEVPDHVIERALTEIDHTQQRRALRMPRRFAFMNGQLRMGLTVASVIVVVAGGAYILGTTGASDGIGETQATLPAGAESARTVDATATLELALARDVASEALANVPPDRDFGRGYEWAGTIDITTAGAAFTGETEMRLEAEWLGSNTGPLVNHSWGAASATLDGAACEGWVAFTFYRESQIAGGALTLRCDDGSVLGGAVTSVTISLSQLTAELDGFYVPAD